MLIPQFRPDGDLILDVIDRAVRDLAESGSEARYVVLGPVAFGRFRRAVAARLGRKPRDFGTYNYLPVVLDPFRGDAVVVLPEPAAMAGGVEAFEIPG